MYKYHAKNKTGKALCGASGSSKGAHVVPVPASDWNGLLPEQRCERCIAKIKESKNK